MQIEQVVLRQSEDRQLDRCHARSRYTQTEIQQTSVSVLLTWYMPKPTYDLQCHGTPHAFPCYSVTACGFCQWYKGSEMLIVGAKETL